MRRRPEIPAEIEDVRDERWCREATRQIETVFDAERFIEHVGFAPAQRRLAGLANQVDAKLGMPPLQLDQPWRHEMVDEDRRPADPHHGDSDAPCGQ